ncbi:MAG: molybdopterin-dependent oxidoreductase [Gammaproteobacteria bacterium]
MAAPERPLPPGQILHGSFERFGLGLFANRFPADPGVVRIHIGGDVAREVVLSTELDGLPRVEQVADFHCVTTWSVCDLKWSGYRFADFYEHVVVPLARPAALAHVVVLKGQDGYRTSMQLEDLLRPDVMLADTLNDAPLGLAHGAPLRVVAPAHYGYKNVKHLGAMEFWTDRRHYRFPFPYPAFMDHPRARVALEERGRWFPQAWLRCLYRLVVPWVRARSRRALERHQRRNGDR